MLKIRSSQDKSGTAFLSKNWEERTNRLNRSMSGVTIQPVLGDNVTFG